MVSDFDDLKAFLPSLINVVGGYRIEILSLTQLVYT